jgi:hypothetical protein
VCVICLLPNSAKRLACLPDTSYARPPQLDPTRDPLKSPITPSPKNMGPLLSGSPPLPTPLTRGGFIAPIKDPNFTPLHDFGGPRKIWFFLHASMGFHRRQPSIRVSIGFKCRIGFHRGQLLPHLTLGNSSWKNATGLWGFTVGIC